MADTGVYFILENLERLLWREMVTAEVKQLRSFLRELQLVRNFLKDSEKKRHEHAEVKALVSQITDLAHEAEDIIESFIVSGGVLQRKRRMAEKVCNLFYPHRIIGDVIKEVKSINEVVRNIYDKNLYGMGMGVPQVGISSHGHGDSSRSIPPSVEQETVVGFDHEAEAMKDRLTGESEQLEIISIVGMAGLGKTTLARKLYNDPFIVYRFYIRGWTYVSQTYRKRDLFLGILSTVVEHEDDEIYAMTDEKLGEELYRRLKGKRYLVVMDDIWHIEAWNDLKRSFPNDNNGSRIMFTTRITDVALQAKPNSPPHFLRFLIEDESWDLLQRKLFLKESCPPDLVEIGKQIAQKCHGLPLTIVVIAGLLAKTEKTHNWWNQVAESVSSYIVTDPEQCMHTLALSYNHLPYYLKPCFLYFGAFPEDYEIPVQKLTWLWIAEGFIVNKRPRAKRVHEGFYEYMTNNYSMEPNDRKELEDVAEEWLMELIDRNLVLVAKKRSTGGIRTCRVHDLLRDLCLRKTKEVNFMQLIYRDEEFSSPSSPVANKQLFMCNHSRFINLPRALCFRKAEEENSLQQIYGYEPQYSSIAKNQRRLCIHSHVFDYISLKPSTPHIRSLLCFASEQHPLPPNYMSFISGAFKLLRVLDLSVIRLPEFPVQILLLVLLRYLAVRGKHLRLPRSISKLWNLQTLIVSKSTRAMIPHTIWKMKTLSHLCIAGENYIEEPSEDGSPLILYNLQTIKQIDSNFCSIVFERTPNLRKLGFCGNLTYDENLFLPNLGLLNHLETLKLLNTCNDRHFYNLQGVEFPQNLRKLTLSNTTLEWKEMSIIGMLPNLEALKLEFQACMGPRWETSDGGFRQLKFLKFYYMDIEEWNASNIHFPSLQRLVLDRCGELKEIPSEFGDISTLQTIEVSWCSHSTVNSARQIQEEQQSMGNDWLKVFIYPPDWELKTYS